MLLDALVSLETNIVIDKEELFEEITLMITNSGYTIAEEDSKRPWGGFFKFQNTDANRFLKEFFPNLDPKKARLGNEELELSPKILIVYPEQRLSWQYHNRRSETWRFLTTGKYKKSNDDNENKDIVAQKDEIVSFKKGERHRLIGLSQNIVFVAEIWQHTDMDNPSDEADIVRLQDDYKR